ncbi:hypothetical protein C2845_PM18G07990 [Panicum miliaceum]|uniref:Uncharacterized protein n=1 Tax=Panicum miliaceum TaxID=4540 RepID=A0A3L6PP79_PANMI|nr:hypothetical protein C2845_PM18G07990 [Panicum miliaceum]
MLVLIHSSTSAAVAAHFGSPPHCFCTVGFFSRSPGHVDQYKSSTNQPCQSNSSSFLFPCFSKGTQHRSITSPLMSCDDRDRFVSGGAWQLDRSLRLSTCGAIKGRVAWLGLASQFASPNLQTFSSSPPSSSSHLTPSPAAVAAP